MIVEIKAIATRTNNRYGKRKIHVELINTGFTLGIYQTASLMRDANVVAIRPMKRHDYPNLAI
jgi:hypothetical protein